MRINSIGTYPISSSAITKYALEINNNFKDENLEYSTLFFQKNPLKYLLKPLFLLKNLRSYDIIHVQYTPTLMGPLFFLFMFFSKFSNSKIILTLHEKPEIYLEKLRFNLLKTLFLIYEKFIYNCSDRLIVHTKEHSKILIDQFKLKSDKITIIPHPIFNSGVLLNNPPKVKVYHKYNLESNKKYLTIFGRIVPKKGYEISFELLHRLPKNYEILIIGDSEDKNYHYKLLDIIKNKNIKKRIHFLGFKEEKELAELFVISDYALFLYKSVTQSGALGMTLSYNVPVICSELPAFKEIFEKYNIGIIKNDIKKIKEQILHGDKKQYQEGIIKIKRDLSTKNIAKETLKVYQEILNGK